MARKLHFLPSDMAPIYDAVSKVLHTKAGTPQSWGYKRPGWTETHGKAQADLLNTYLNSGRAAYEKLREVYYPSPLTDARAAATYGLLTIEVPHFDAWFDYIVANAIE